MTRDEVLSEIFVIVLYLTLIYNQISFGLPSMWKKKSVKEKKIAAKISNFKDFLL